MTESAVEVLNIITGGYRHEAAVPVPKIIIQ